MHTEEEEKKEEEKTRCWYCAARRMQLENKLKAASDLETLMTNNMYRDMSSSGLNLVGEQTKGTFKKNKLRWSL